MEAGLSREDVIVITGDAGFGIFDDFQARRPKQFYNMGIAEQNTAGFAAGLSFARLTGSSSTTSSPSSSTAATSTSATTCATSGCPS